jgi:hypothetical protein
MHKPLLVAIWIVPLILAACETSRSRVDSDDRMAQYTIYVDAISETNQNGKTFIITSGMKDVIDSDLRFKEFARIASKALQKKGFVQTDNIKSATIIVLLSYGISGPITTTQTHLIPVFKPQYGTTTQMTNQFGQPMGSFETHSSNPYQVDLHPITEEETTYSRAIILGAYEVEAQRKPAKEAKSNPPKMLWETKIISNGHAKDLRKLFPVMMHASIPFLGENTGEQIKIELEISNDDQNIRNLTNVVPVDSTHEE